MNRARVVALAAAGILVATLLAAGGQAAPAGTKWTDAPTTVAGRNWGGATAVTTGTKWG